MPLFDDSTRTRIDPYTRNTVVNRLAKLVQIERQWREDTNDAGQQLLTRAITVYVEYCEWVGASGVAALILKNGGR